MKSICAFVMGLCLIGVAQAEIENGSFENGLTGWEVSGFDPATASEFTANFRANIADPVTVLPVDGSNLAVLKCGGNSEMLNFGQITQTLTFSAGDVLSGSYFFATGDYLRWNDWATITLVPLSEEFSEIQVVYADVAAVGDFGSMHDWESFGYTFDESTAGTYTLVLKVHDAEDTILSSYLVVDDISVVPEPATLSLLALGALTTLRRKKACK